MLHLCVLGVLNKVSVHCRPNPGQQHFFTTGNAILEQVPKILNSNLPILTTWAPNYLNLSVSGVQNTHFYVVFKMVLEDISIIFMLQLNFIKKTSNFNHSHLKTLLWLTSTLFLDCVLWKCLHVIVITIMWSNFWCNNQPFMRHNCAVHWDYIIVQYQSKS